MNKQRKTSNILNVFQYDETTGAVTLPSTLVLTAPANSDNSTKVPTTSWTRSYVSEYVQGYSYLTGNQTITISGDASGSGTTSINLTLANTAVTPGTYGSTTLVPVVTVDSKGRITNVTTAAISGALTFTGDVTGSGTTGTSTALTLANSGVTAGTYTKVTVDLKGRVTVGASATTSDIAEGTNLYYTDARVLAYLGANNYATQLYVGTQIANLVASAPAALDTLNELAAALGNDASFATTTATSLGNRLRVDIGTQGLTSTQQGYGRTNLGLGTAATSAIGDFATAAQGTKADSAFGWGNHASAGYLTTSSAASTYQPLDADLTSIAGLLGTTGFLKKTAANTWALDTNTYLTSFTESDPIYTASSWYSTTNNAANWNTAYGWGNHASGGYLTTSSASSTYQTILTNPVTGTGTTNYLPKFTGTSTIGNSIVYDNGTNVGINTNSPIGKLSWVDAYYNSTYVAGNPYYGTALMLSGDAGSDQRTWRIWSRYNSAGGGGIALSFEYSTNGVGYGVSPAALSYTQALIINSSGAATFSSSVSATGASIGRVVMDYDGTDSWFRMQSGNRMRITTTGGTDFIIPNTGNMTYNGNTVWHAGNLTNLNQLSNGPGYITGITSANVTGALGYTPYNSSNPNGYITNALFGAGTTSGTLDWNDVSNTRPGGTSTLLLGTATNGMGGGTYYHPFNLEYSSKDGTGNVTQMAIAYGSPGNELYMRGRYSGSWGSWVRFLNSSNYNSYSPTLTGGGASGTWGIRITGFANQGSQRLYSTDSAYNYDAANPYFGYLTYDGTYWQFKVSPASPDRVRVYTADTLGGASANQTGGANTIVQRDSNGYIQNSYFYTSGGGAERGTGISYIAGFNSSDYYIRSYTLQGLASAMSGSSMNISGNASTASQVINNTDGAVMMESNASENNNWLFKENSKAWGLFWFNRGSQSGQTIGGYTTVGAELMFMGGSSGIAMPSGWTGYYSGSYIAAMISNYTGYIYSASTIYAATSMVVGGNIVIHAGTIGSQSVNYASTAGSATTASRIEVGNNQWIWSNGAHTATNPNTITLWDQYSTNGGAGYLTSYATILDIYGRSSHEHDQFYLDSSGTVYHRNCFYGTNTWNGWRTMMDSSNASYAWNMNQNVRTDSNVTFNQVYSQDWFRSSGTTGWYNSSYAVGIYAIDSTWVRTYNNAQFYSSTVIQAGGSVRAPIFYDSDNTGYYLDPNSTSNVYRLNVENYLYASNDNGRIYLGGHLHIDSLNGNEIYLNYYSNATIRIYGTTNFQGYNATNINTGTANESFRAPIFYDSNDTSYYLDPNASGTSLRIAGNIHSDGSFGTNGYSSSSPNVVSRVFAPKGAAFSSDGSTGAIRIKLPFRASNPMWTMKVRIYNYSTNETSEYLLGNYSYDQGGYNSSATFLGGNSAAALTVRFGNQDGVDCVWIGETNTSWSYPVVSVLDFTSGFRGSDAGAQGTGWNISIVTSFGTIGTTITPNVKFAGLSAYSIQGTSNVAGTGAASYHPSGVYSTGTNWLYGTMYLNGNTIYDVNQIHAYIYYDRDDTNYFGDFAGQSRFSRLNLSTNQVQAANNAGGRLRVSSYTNGESEINGNCHNIHLGPYSTRTGAGLYYAGIAIGGLMNYGGSTTYDVAPHIWLGAYYRDTPGSERSDFIVAIKSGTGVSGAGSDLPEPRFRVDYQGIASATGSFRAPTFYSSENTNKYLTNNGSTYGAWYIGGNNNGYSGFRFDGDMQLMMHTNGAAGPCGFWLGNWSILTYVNGSQFLYHNGSQKFQTQSDGVRIEGTLYATGDVIAYYSDIRLKKDVIVIDSALSKIQQLRGVTYTWNDEEVNKIKYRAGTRDIGLIAQEVEAVEPLLITEYQSQLNTPDNDPDKAADFVPIMSETYKTIKYEKLVALLVEGIKEQQKQIEDLKKQIEYLVDNK